MDILPRPSKGRKSLLTQQAEAAGLSFTGYQVDSFLQDFPRNLKENAANHQPRRTSGGGPSLGPRISEMFTPQNNPNRGTGRATSSGQTHIPIPRRLPLAADKSRLQPKPPRGGKQPNSRVAPNSTSRSATKLRRSISHDSLANSLYTTPLSRARSQSPRSAGPNRTMSAAPPGTRVDMSGIKKIPPPQTSDNATISTMIKKIIETLKNVNFYKEFEIKTFKQLSTKDFYGICNCLLGYLVGPNTGPNKKDDVTYILDSLQILSYPGQFTKSHAKSHNVPHTQPYVYTMFSWLCCRVDRFLNPHETRDIGLELEGQDDAENVALESYNRLFFKLLSEKEDDITEELASYRERIQALFLEDLGEHKTKEELLAMIEKNQQERDKLFASSDPRKDTIEALKTQDEMLGVIKKRISELEEMKLKFSNVTSIESEETVLKSDLSRQRRILTTLEETVSNQEFSHEAAEKLREDTKTLKNQQEAIEKINEDLKKQVNRQQQFLKNDETRFYEICGKFSILEIYNNLVKNFDDPMIPLIDKNPLEPKALQNWLKDVAEKIAITKRRIDSLMSTWNERLKNADWKLAHLEGVQNRLQDEYEKMSSELSFSCNERNQRVEELENEVQKVRADRNAAKEVYQNLAEKHLEEKKNLQKLLDDFAEARKLNDDLASYSDDLDKAVDEHTNIYRLAEIETRQMLLAFVIDARNQVNGPIDFEALQSGQ